MYTPDTPEEGGRSHYGWLRATMWLLGFELGTFGRAVSALNRSLSHPAPSDDFRILLFFLFHSELKKCNQHSLECFFLAMASVEVSLLTAVAVRI